MLFQRSVEATAVDALRIYKLNPHTDRRWQDFVRNHPNGSIYHHPAWIKALEDEYEQEPAHLACETDAGELVGILPLLYTRGMPLQLGGPLAGPRLSSLPRTPVAGPLITNPNAAVFLLRHAVKLARQDPRLRLEIKTNSSEFEGAIDGLVRSPWRSVYVLELDRQSRTFEVPQVHRNIVKAYRNGLRVRLADSEADLRAWYRIYLATMRRSFVPPRPYRFFASLFRNLCPRGMMELRLGELGSGAGRTLVAGAIFLRYGRTVSYAFGAMNRRYSSLCANDVIHSQAINGGCAEGYHRFDFGEVPEGHTELARYKRKWGALPFPSIRYYSPALAETAQSLDNAPQKFKRWVWGRLPLQVTAWIGDRLYSRM
jgi:CelD/BcsL family acetyltransferase involved in cellulose biosynthesis